MGIYNIKIMIDSRFYYYLINSASNKALAFKNAKDPSKQNAMLTDTSEDSQDQIWMLKKTHFESVYYLTHCLTGLVVEKSKNKLELHHQHQKNSQYFMIDETHSENGEIWIKEYTEPTNVLTFEKALECKKGEVTSPSSFWKLKQVKNNLLINRSCIISCQFSGYVMQAGLDNGKQGKGVQKASWVGCFNQRWEIKKVNAFFIIRNLKNNLLISLNEKKIKEGSPIILASENSTYHYQLWSLEERGYNTYSIKTAYHEELYIGSPEPDLNEGSTVTLVRNEFKNFWKIIGPILI